MSGDKRVLPALLVAVVWLVLWAARPGVAQGPGPEATPAQFTASTPTGISVFAAPSVKPRCHAAYSSQLCEARKAFSAAARG